MINYCFVVFTVVRNGSLTYASVEIKKKKQLFEVDSAFVFLLR